MKSDTIVEVSFRGDPSHWVPERVFNLGNGSSFVLYVMLRIKDRIMVKSVPAIKLEVECAEKIKGYMTKADHKKYPVLI